ncbi:MAG: 50S ribosomal protein L24 [Nanobdellota archaeon]
MTSTYSNKWKSSSNPRKQKKFSFNAPHHKKSKMLRAPLSKELQKKYNTRSVRVRKGDKVIVKRGQFKDKSGAVSKADMAGGKLFIDGVDFTKKDGSKVPYPINPSNVSITTLYSDDARRFKRAKSTTTTKSEE